MAVSTIEVVKSLPYIDKNYSYEYTIGANAALTVSQSDLGISTPEGYMFMTYMSIGTGNTNVVPRNIAATYMGLRNLSSSTQTGTLAVTMRYLKRTI